MTGIGMMRVIKSCRATANLPFVLYSALAIAPRTLELAPRPMDDAFGLDGMTAEEVAARIDEVLLRP